MAGIESIYGPDGADAYTQLVSRFPLRPLRAEADLDAAIGVMGKLLGVANRPAPVQDYLDVLCHLIHKYESNHVALTPVADADMLRFLIDHKGVTQAEVAAGAEIVESTISEILSGRRRVNRRQIGKLARYFHVEPGVFAFTD